MTSALETAHDGPLIFISAAEPSADLHGASLIRAMRRICPRARFAGVAGPAMRDEGCWAIFDMCGASAMLAAAVRSAGSARRMWATARAHLAEYPFDAAVVIDSPTLHLPLAKHAKRLGVPVFYFIAPQVWAWGEFRTGRIRRRVDRMAVILPFEEEFFRSRGIDATFVGHPLFETLMARSVDEVVSQQIKDRGSPIVALMPGSRKHVVREVLPGQLRVAARVAARFTNAHFPISVANPQVRQVAGPLIDKSGLPISVHTGSNGEMLTAADVVLVASGTATLEAAYYHTPMVVMYNGSKWGYRLIGRWLIRTRHLSLVNILAGREVVPEFMPYYTSVKPIAARTLELLSSPELRTKIAVELAETVGPLLKPGAAENTAALLMEMLEGREAGAKHSRIRGTEGQAKTELA
ncbi:MAG: lipid-A-disaccharide synthase [Phycisphaerales bacterium]|nr:MAG: lipid-A-disaccharide synthase [Phycisphaerales bacterium]